MRSTRSSRSSRSATLGRCVSRACACRAPAASRDALRKYGSRIHACVARTSPSCRCVRLDSRPVRMPSSQLSLRTHATCRIASHWSAQLLLRSEDPHRPEIRWATSLRTFFRWIVLNQAAPIATTSDRRRVRWIVRRKSSPNRRRENVISAAHELEIPGRAQKHPAVNSRRVPEGPSAQPSVARNRYLCAEFFTPANASACPS
jgi:hypothetical protein